MSVKDRMFDQPIILIGAARSGTKFLRDCLATSPDCVAVPYDINYIWRYDQTKLEHDVLDPKLISSKTQTFIRNTIPKLAKAEAGNTIIEKTVSNTLRIPFVNEIYPQARFVHLIRDGREVVESSMRQWTDPPDTGALLKKLKSLPIQNIGYVFWYAKNIQSGLFKGGRKGGNIWGPRYPGIMDDVETASLAKICANQWKHCIETSLKDFAQINSNRVHTIRYEDFISGRESIVKLAQNLELSHPETCGDAMEKNLRKMDGVPSWTQLPKNDIDNIKFILSDSLENLGYT